MHVPWRHALVRQRLDLIFSHKNSSSWKITQIIPGNRRKGIESCHARTNSGSHRNGQRVAEATRLRPTVQHTGCCFSFVLLLLLLYITLRHVLLRQVRKFPSRVLASSSGVCVCVFPFSLCFIYFPFDSCHPFFAAVGHQLKQR